MQTRNAIPEVERLAKSRQIWNHLREIPAFFDAEIVLAYMDYRSEVMTTGLIEELLLSGQGKRVFVPLVEGMTISFYEIKSLSDLHSGYQEIREPIADPEKKFTKELLRAHKCIVLAPGSVFDMDLGRMGYGKGFYDKFLSLYPDLTRVGLAFSSQIAPFSLPLTDEDQRMSMIVTENGVI